MPEIKECLRCGILFEASYPTKKFCSRYCYLAYRKMKANEKKMAEETLVSEEDNPSYPPICEVCGSPKYMGRCVRFTQHAKNQPK